MKAESPDIRPFDPKSTSPQVWQALNELENCALAERLPDDPPDPLDETIKDWTNFPDFLRVSAWLVWAQDGRLVGQGMIGLIDMPENRHLAQAMLYIHPEWRRQGIAKRLLRELVAVAAVDERRMLMSQIAEAVPSGLAFVQRIGGQVGLEMHINRLLLNVVDRGQLHGWVERGQQMAGDYDLVFWDGAYPEEDLDNIANMMGAMNQAPMGEMDIAEIQWTPEVLRELDASLQRRGQGRWTYAARQRSSGILAGYTEIMWRPSKPQTGYQGGTGVLEDHRGRSLGRWLKAAMLLKILEERPELKDIRTGNADMNAPMLKINNELGFKPFQGRSMCQATVEGLQAYMDAGSAPA